MTRCESYPPCFGTIYFPTAPCFYSSLVVSQPILLYFLYPGNITIYHH